jgi:hypothetical protein
MADFRNKNLPLIVKVFRYVMPCFLLSLFFFPSLVFTQNTTDSLYFSTLENQIRNGDKRALRALVSIWGTSPKVQDLFDNYTIIPSPIFKSSASVTRERALDFFYENQNKLSYSYLYNAFAYDGLNDYPLQIKAVPSVVKHKNNREQYFIIETLWKQNNIDSVSALINRLSGTDNGDDFLKILNKIIFDKKISEFSQKQRVALFKNIADALSHFHSEESFELLLQLVEQDKLPAALISWPLARLTNVFAAHEVKDNQIVMRYRFYHDSLKTLEAMRLFGYERYRPTMQRLYFDQDVDYFGALVAMAFQNDSYWWIRENALVDMMKTKHPRLLFYLSTQAFKERNRFFRFGYNSQYFLNLLDSYSAEHIDFQVDSGSEKNKELQLLKQHLAYWTKYWEDYEWDEYRHLFVNKKQKLAQKEHYERLFRRFSSTNSGISRIE